MMNKKFLVLSFLLILMSFSFADSITDYVISDNVPLNQGVTATGTYTGDVNSGVKCSFYFFDSLGNPITRATDEYTDEQGRFFMPPFIVKEPIFQRYLDYNIVTSCGSASVNDSFNVGQKQEIAPYLYPQGMINDLVFWTDPENSYTSVFIGVLVILFCAFIYVMYKKMT